jgi:energy-coupling factor transport system ATP-binding protein
VDAGQLLAVVGGNGSGKSTLAKHLNALLLPTGGTVLIDGMNTQDPDAVWDIRRRVGMVFQNPDNQIVATVVEEDVAFGPENLGIPPEEIRERVESSLGAVDMLRFRRQEPHLLSGGQKQRVAIAGILAMHPQCVVLDEATTMLDPQGQREVMDTVGRLIAEGITVIHITHSMDEALRCHRVVVMHAGRIAMDGTPQDVFSRVDELDALRLTLPPIPRLAQQLRAAGLPIPPATFGPDQLAEAIAAAARGAAEERTDGLH